MARATIKAGASRVKAASARKTPPAAVAGAKGTVKTAVRPTQYWVTYDEDGDHPVIFTDRALANSYRDVFNVDGSVEPAEIFDINRTSPRQIFKLTNRNQGTCIDGLLERMSSALEDKKDYHRLSRLVAWRKANRTGINNYEGQNTQSSAGFKRLMLSLYTLAFELFDIR